MRTFGLLALIVALLPLEARAQFTDFEDLVLNTAYAPGSSFISNGISFDVVPFGSTPSKIYIQTFGSADGSGLELSMANSIGVDFVLPAPAKQISFRYGEFCCDSGVEINGVLNVPAGGLVALNGITVGGAMLSVTSSGAGNDQGMFTATGAITSFIVGGTEFAMDDLRVIVPEPSSWALALLGSVVFWRRRPGARVPLLTC